MQQALKPPKMIKLLTELMSDGLWRVPQELHREHNLIPTSACFALLQMTRAGIVIRDGEPGRYRYRLNTNTQLLDAAE